MEHQDWKPVLMNKPNKTVTKKQNQIVISKDAKLDSNGDFPQKKKKQLLGNQIRDMRNLRGLTQKQLAKDLNISLQALQNYENNKEEIPGNIKTLLQKKTGIKFVY
tara:strand:+ start:222 stop:539 length:318 start_codon:yes stop_codon:yes gene_type:complete